MKKRAFRRIRKRLGKLVARWMVPLGLKWWSIKCTYYQDTPPSFKKSEGCQVAAKTYADWQYMSAQIEFNVPACQNMDERDLENLIVHELCHILVSEMREGKLHHEERVCTRLAQAFQWTKEGY